jgi:hypothetical protein
LIILEIIKNMIFILEGSDPSKHYVSRMRPLKFLFLFFSAIALAAADSHAQGYAYFPVENGLVLGLDASIINTSDTNEVILQSGTMYLQSWFDYSGNGNNATQSITADQPTYVPNAFTNGMPAVQFNGVNSFLTTALAQITGNKSIFIVEKRTGTKLGTELASTTGSGGNFLGDTYGGGDEAEGRIDVASDLYLPASPNHFILKSYVYNGTKGTLAVNGTSVGYTVIDSAAGNYAISDPFLFRFPGEIAEILIFNRAVTADEQASIVSYLNDKWGLQDTPPPVVAGLQLRLAADTIDTTNSSEVSVQNGNYSVANWPDSSGNGLQATQSTPSAQPLYVPDGVYGEPAVQFSGSGQYLTTNLPQIAGNKSIFVVERRADNALRCELSSSALTSGMFLGSGWGASIESEGRLDVAQDMAMGGYVNGYILKSFIRSGGTCTLNVNDTSTVAQVPDAASGTYTISDPNFCFSGQIAEMLIYNRAVSGTEQQLIEDYLSQKYGLWEPWLQDRSGLNLWLDSGAVQTGTTYQYPQVSGTNLAVNTWLDRSSYGSTAVQSGTANQPLYCPAGQGGTNLPVIRFDGTAAKYMTTALPQTSGDKSIFVVQRRRGQALGREISSTTGTGLAFENYNGTIEAKGPVGGTSTLQAPGDFYKYIIKDFIRSGTNESLWVNDVPATATGTGGDTVGGNISISDPTAPFVGDIGTVLAYPRAVSTAERYSIEDYLQNRWSYAPNNIYSVTPDQVLPPDTNTVTPAAGVMVQQSAPGFAGTGIYNTLYLPIGWQPGQKYPIIVEYPPNGGYTDSGYTTTGYPEDCALGYGISGGYGYIVIGMPCISINPLAIATQWWGDVPTTKAYCMSEIQNVCKNYGGDPSAIFLAGFSRGAAACNYIGLNDSNIADTWLAFIPHSGYDYDSEYPPQYAAPTPGIEWASTRLGRLEGRAQYVSQGSIYEGDWEVSFKYYLETLLSNLSNFTFRTLPYENHTGSWTLRPIQLRRDIRAWMQQILATRPGTSSISGYIYNQANNPVPGALVQSGSTHYTYTLPNGTYVLPSLINSTRTVTVTAGSYIFKPRTVTLSGSNVMENFQSSN